MRENQAPDASTRPTKSSAEYWVEGTSQMLDIGMVIMSEDLQIRYVNDKALDLLDLEEFKANKPEAITSIIYKMAERGDFGEIDLVPFTQSYADDLKRFAGGEDIQGFKRKLHPPNGKTVKISRHLCGDNSIITTLEDVTEQAKKYEVFDIALELGKSGYWHYNFRTKKFSIHSDYLDGLLTPGEKQKLEQEGFWALIHPDDIPDCRQQWEDTVKRQENFDRVLRVKTEQNGVKWFKLHARPQEATGTRLANFICFFEDVTDDLALQDALRKAKEQAEKTLQAQNNFLARLSHEIRTPMNAVIGITDALVQYQGNSEITPKLELIQSSADSIMNILEGTLNQSKLDSDKLMLDPKPGNPRDTVKSICALWEQQAKKNGTTIRCHIDDKAPDEIIFDRFRYEQCLNNLLSNAVKFTPNGKVDVVLTLVGDDSPKPRLVLAVRDNGIGMTPKQQSRIFEAYTQADKTISSRFGGTGLGMSITKQIIGLMGGQISVKSEMGKGTVFALTLPVDIKKVQAEKEINANDAIMDHILEEAKPEETPYSNLKILVADDNATNHMVIESLLTSVVSEIHKANNGQEVIDILKVQDIDIILMDIHMPVMDGIEATLAIRGANEDWSDKIIIAVTADPQYQQLRICRNIGMDETLAKPIKLSGILEAFDKVLSIDRANAPYTDIYKKAV